jgi:hypothetical protein
VTPSLSHHPPTFVAMNTRTRRLFDAHREATVSRLTGEGLSLERAALGLVFFDDGVCP